MSRTLKWIGVVVVPLTLLIGAVGALSDANYLRSTIARVITAKTGRQLAINEDLQWKLDWPQIRLHAIDVTFANPPWAREKQMIAACGGRIVGRSAAALGRKSFPAGGATR